MNQHPRLWLWLPLSIVACAVSWSYMHRVLLPWEYYVNVKQGRVKAQMGDLYPRWVGTRELLLHGRNPYGTEVSHEIQMAFYGHSIEQSYDKPESEIIDEQRFVYPVYVVLLLAPTVHADFGQLQTWAPAVLAGLTAVGIWLWLGVLRWRPPPLVRVKLNLAGAEQSADRAGVATAAVRASGCVSCCACHLVRDPSALLHGGRSARTFDNQASDGGALPSVVSSLEPWQLEKTVALGRWIWHCIWDISWRWRTAAARVAALFSRGSRRL